jgi:hypothetical protein
MMVMLAAAKLEVEHAGLERLVNQMEQQTPVEMTDAMRRTSLFAIIEQLKQRRLKSASPGKSIGCAKLPIVSHSPDA